MSGDRDGCDYGGLWFQPIRLTAVRAVVTGGAGSIGSNVADALVEAGSKVLVVDDLSNGSLRNLEHARASSAQFVELDVRDGAQVEEIFRSFRPELVFHLAAQTTSGLRWRSRPATRA